MSGFDPDALLPIDKARSLYARILAVVRQSDPEDPDIVAEVEAILAEQRAKGLRP